MDLNAEDHIRVQAAIQRWVDSSISKTANAPNDFTVEDTKSLYELAFDLGCKGVTIYRDGSRDTQVLTTEKKDAEKQEAAQPEPSAEPASEPASIAAASEPAPAVVDLSASSSGNAYLRRPQVLRGATYKINTPFGMAYITINDYDHTPAEIFLNVGKAGSDVFAMAEALGRVCSLFLRYGDHGNKVELLIKHLKGIGGSGAIGFGANRVESIADAVAKALETHIHETGSQPNGIDPAPIAATMEQVEPKAVTIGAKGSADSRDLCPSCGTASLLNVEGCKTCANCGYSRCN